MRTWTAAGVAIILAAGCGEGGGGGHGGGSGIPPSAGWIQFSATNYTAPEYASALGGVIPIPTIVVKRIGGTSGRATIEWATVNGGTATPKEDYLPASGVLTWEDGDDSDRIVTFTIIDDTVPEPNETVFVLLQHPTGGAELGSPNLSTVTIIDDDAGPIVGPGT